VNGESQLEAFAVPSVPLEPGMKNCHLCTAHAHIQIQIQNIYLLRISDEHLIQPIKHKLCVVLRSHLDKSFNTCSHASAQPYGHSSMGLP
jgi:hypothetical protein